MKRMEVLLLWTGEKEEMKAVQVDKEEKEEGMMVWIRHKSTEDSSFQHVPDEMHWQKKETLHYHWMEIPISYLSKLEYLTALMTAETESWQKADVSAAEEAEQGASASKDPATSW